MISHEKDYPKPFAIEFQLNWFKYFQVNSYYPFQQVDVEVAEPTTGMVKSRSANALAKRRQKLPEILKPAEPRSNSGMIRDPISVPNFRALTLTTPVLTPVEAARLVFVDPDEDTDDEYNKNPPTSRLIEVAEAETRYFNIKSGKKNFADQVFFS